MTAPKDGLAASDQLHLLKCVQIKTDMGEWHGIFTYPGCGWDLVQLGHVINLEPEGSGVEITDKGRSFLTDNAHNLKTDIYKFMST